MSAVLLIDDEPISNFITKKLLESFGYTKEVVDYTSPTEAFKVLNKKEEMVLFLDLNMPEMSGWDFLEKMKSENIQHKTVIITASSNEVAVQERAKDFSFVKGCLKKPLNMKIFKDFIDREQL